ncbi:Neurotransmitter-gated ion-channel transmembrane region [Cooperia oncophora]
MKGSYGSLKSSGTSRNSPSPRDTSGPRNCFITTTARDFSRGFVDTNLHANYYGEWIYDTSQLDLMILERYDGKSPFTRDSFTENGEMGNLLNKYATVVFELHLRRRTLFFMYNIVAPCVMLSILTMMQFLLPCESGEKVTLGLTVLLAYSVFSFNIAESMPETSEVIPLIAIYLMAIYGYISAVGELLGIIGFSILAPVFGGTPSRSRSKSISAQNKCSVRSDSSNCDDLVSKDLVAEQSVERLVARWSQLANIFDRLFFTVVLTLNGGSTLFLLIVAPSFDTPTLYNRVWEL